MGSVMESVDATLLAYAEATLSASNYQVAPLRIEAVDAVVATQNQNVVVVGAFFTVADLLLHEGLLAEAASDVPTPFDRRDRYLVLLTSQEATKDDATPIYDVNYNMQRVRRIVKAGVEASPIGVARALRPVLPLPLTVDSTAATDPMQALRSYLIESGVPPRVLTSALDRFGIEDDGRIGAALELTDEPSEEVEDG